MGYRVLKPSPGNDVGLSPEQTLIGTDAKNARIVVSDAHMDNTGMISFIKSFFWNAAAWNTYEAEMLASPAIPHTVLPFRQEGVRFQGDEDGSGPKSQAVAYTLAQYPGYEV